MPATSQLDHVKLVWVYSYQNILLSIVFNLCNKVNQVCMYKYTSKQQQFGIKQKQAISVQATIETLCNSGELHAHAILITLFIFFCSWQIQWHRSN